MAEPSSGQPVASSVAVPQAPLPEARAHPPSEQVAAPLFELGGPGPASKKRGRPRASLTAVLREGFGRVPAGAAVHPKRRAEAPAGPSSTPALPFAQPAPITISSAELPIQRSRQGRPGARPILDSWLLISSWGQQQPTDSEDPIVPIAKHFLEPKNYHLTSKVVLERLIGIDNKAMQKRLFMYGATLYLQQLAERRRLEEEVERSVSPQGLVCYIDSGAYDETPLKLSLRDPLPGSSADSMERNKAAGGQTRPTSSRSETAVCKVLQTTSAFAILIHISSGLLGLIGQHYSPLQSMGNTQGDILAECLARNSGVSHHSDRFGLRCRSYCTDKAGYNARAEELVCEHRQRGWASCLTFCELHALAGIHKKVFEAFFPEHITGIIHMSLSLRLQSSWRTFRIALTEVIRQRVQLVCGTLPESARRHKRHLLELAGDGTNHLSIEKLVSLLSAANGDWRRRDVVEVYWHSAHGPPPSLQSIAPKVASNLTAALAGRKPALWRRDKWTGFKAAVLDVWLLDQVHGLLEPAYNRFLEILQDLPESRPAPAASSTTRPPVSTAQPGPVPVEQQQPGSPGQPAPSAQDNSKDRAAAHKWISNHPSSVLTVMVVALTPLEKLFHAHFKLSGAEFERSQRASVARGAVVR